MEQFCAENDITIVHGSPRTSTTQGLVERHNRTWKEDIRALILSTANKQTKTWCQYVKETSYTRNITHHRATKMTPYEACYGLKPHRETTSNPDSNTPPRGTITGARTNTESHTA